MLVTLLTELVLWLTEPLPGWVSRTPRWSSRGLSVVGAWDGIAMAVGTQRVSDMALGFTCGIALRVPPALRAAGR